MAVVVEKRKDGSKSVKLMFHDKDGKPLYETKTKQCFAEECDINNIVNRFRRNNTGENCGGRRTAPYSG